MKNYLLISIILISFGLSTSLVASENYYKHLIANQHPVIQDTVIPYPWSLFDMTSQTMKPGYPFAQAKKNNILPYLFAIPAGGALTYFLVNNDNTSSGCAFVVNSDIQSAVCGLDNGSISLTLNPPDNYIYRWSNGLQTSSISNLSAGSYQVTISLPNQECRQVLNLNVPNEAIDIQLEISGNAADCMQANGSASVIATPENAYQYNWSDGGAGASRTDLTAGLYSVTVSLGSTCFKSASIEISELASNFSLSVSSLPAHCDNNDGSATAIAEPPGNYSFLWSDGTTSATNANLSSGEYTVTVSDINGCSLTQSVTVEETVSSFSISLTSLPAHCNNNDGSAEVIAEPPGNYTYIWSDGTSSSSITGLGSGEYSITVSDHNGCSITESILVDALDADFTLSLTSSPSHCGNNDGSAEVSVDPQGNYSYLWSNGASTAAIADLSAGEYSVTVSDNNGCSKVQSIELNNLISDFTISVSSLPANCGKSDGSAEVVVDPPDSYTYLWSDGSTAAINTDLSTGEYAVTVSDIYGCTASQTILVEELATDITIDIQTQSAHCGLNDGIANLIISPPSTYDYTWLDGTIENPNTSLSAGQHSVTVSDASGCSTTAIFEIDEVPSTLFNSVDSSPGNCVSSGNILLSLQTNGPGLIVLEFQGPTPATQILLPAGDHALADYAVIPPGDYFLTAYDQSAGPACLDSIAISVADTSISIHTINDTFSTSNHLVLNENVLKNDSGYGLKLESIDSIIGGTVSFAPNGNFAFVPQAGFSDTASFRYIAMDTCMLRDTAFAFIEVSETICDFEVNFSTQNASCGDSDGVIQAMAEPAGNYSYVWNNGTTGSLLEGIASGIYQLTVSDLDLNCSLVFSAELDELPVSYLTDLEIMQADCNLDANIIFELADNTNGNYVIEVFHPNGDDEFEVGDGVIFLGDYVVIEEGDYFVSIWDASIGYPCIDGFEATIEPTEGILIEAVDISPASGPTASDGEIAVEIITGGVEPYTVLLNGLPIFTVSGSLFTISGLASAEYSIQIIDSDGCPSNIIDVFVPFQNSSQFKPSFSILQYTDFIDNVEHPLATETHYTSIPVFQNAVNYKAFNTQHQSIVSATLSDRYSDANRAIYYSHFIRIKRLEYEAFSFDLDIGATAKIGEPSYVQWHVFAEFSNSSPVLKKMQLRMGASMFQGRIYPSSQMNISF